MIVVGFKDGGEALYNDSEYTDYEYMGPVFVVRDNSKWIGMYNMDVVSHVEWKPDGDKAEEQKYKNMV